MGRHRPSGVARAVWWNDLSAKVWLLLDEHGQVVAFWLLLLEEAGIPPIIPGDFLMILTGVRAAEGKLPLWLALVSLELATVVGGSLLYFVCRWGGQTVINRLGSFIGITSERIDRIARSLDRHGSVAIIIGRLIPSLCILTAVAAGALRLPYRRFLPSLAIGGFIHLAIFVMLGYLLGPPVLSLAERVHLPFELVASTLVCMVLGVWIARIALTDTDPGHVLEAERLGERIRDGTLAGLVAAIESTLLLNVLIHVMALLQIPLPGDALGANTLLGRSDRPALIILLSPAFLMIHVLWGTVYGLWIGQRLNGPYWLRGLVFSLIPLATSLLVTLPLVGVGPFGVYLESGSVPALGETIRHLAYGAVLGITYHALARRWH